jgi:ParB-like chromosome segregation protein Spo0J
VNIRSLVGLDDTELKQSLKQFGWNEHLPALVDENDVTLVGHRRLRLAKQLGIEPVIKKIKFGSGDTADAERVKLAIASNIGGQPLSRNDRKHIAEHLYGKREWTMESIAKALNVSQQQVSKDLTGLQLSSKPSRPKGGRPKGRRRKSRPRQTASKEATIIGLSDSGMTSPQIAVEVGVEGRAVRHVLEDERTRAHD